MSMFKEPSGYFAEEKPFTFEEYVLQSGLRLRLRLVGHSTLWGHHLWNGARILAEYVQTHRDDLVNSSTILELGAGAGLPSLICALEGADIVVVTDYAGDHDLIENLSYNVGILPARLRSKVFTEGYSWGDDIEPLIRHLPSPARTFRLLILADLLFNHSCHSSLLKTILLTLERSTSACALVFFTPYRPWLLERDMAFFDIIRADGQLEVEEIGKWEMDNVMFEEDRGDEVLRRTVFGYKLYWTGDILKSWKQGGT